MTKPSLSKQGRYKKRGWVYCIRVGDLVKIGFTKSIRTRSYSFKKHGDFELLGCISSSYGFEQELHSILAPSLHHGKEWYNYTDQSKWAIETFFGTKNKLEIGKPIGNTDGPLRPATS